MTEQCRIILDVDTGIDDALAILYALGREKITLEALTTTYGNIDVDIATRNSLQLLELAERPDIPVARDVSRPRPTISGFTKRLQTAASGSWGSTSITAPWPAVRCMIRHSSAWIR